MTTKMHDMLIDEIAFVFDVLEHEPVNALETIDTIGEAKAQADGYAYSWQDDLPEGLRDPEIMMMVWNYCVMELRKADALRNDERIAEAHPDFIRFRDQYEDGTSAWFDPEQVSDALLRAGYDEEHRRIVLAALKAASAKQ